MTGFKAKTPTSPEPRIAEIAIMLIPMFPLCSTCVGSSGSSHRRMGSRHYQPGGQGSAGWMELTQPTALLWADWYSEKQASRLMRFASFTAFYGLHLAQGFPA